METRRVVTAFLQYGSKILVLRRGAGVRTFPGRWAGVSGSIEAGRTPEEQARIEVQEEVGLADDEIFLEVAGVPLRAEDRSSGRA
ncbi:MAG TPA: NUDIX domain-containing protein, partial [Chloroflexota bacterium]|nr:NUDIX domain-containing protein [Chloroflexota bacterium]